MKRLALMIALALPQMAGAQSDPFMDLTMPNLGAPAGQEDVAPPDGAAVPQPDPFVDLTMPDMSERTAEPSLYGCPPQERPAWRENLSGREVYKSRLLTEIYDAIWIRNVESAGTCNCETRVPSWDEADLIYQTIFANMDISDQKNAELKINVANRIRRREAEKLCNKEMQ
ncbi:hypothetical protein [Paracoccus sp. (in: a-proteobacteria)]|uniref:hypothetical protein n=1 Tax=Paracoccus sp. TaxID=267 RepID=UPI0026DFC848|nr:hypothetical protein [Paracoccus sp. (in: a-proteobacteria)]MDO5370677.1 hypothetical protein [Paracoccus sp. (in: a-proteobacteria)]